MSASAAMNTQTYRASVANEIQQRITTHQRLLATTGFLGSTDPARPLNLLAAGDSWFDYPLTDDVPLIPSDIVFQLGRLITPRPFILNLAHHGDATTELLGVTKRKLLLDALQTHGNGTFDAILFSGGGDDLVGDQFRFWLRDAEAVGGDPAKALNQDALADILGVVKTAYADLVATRNRAGNGIPIFVHAYDFAYPTDKGVCGLGPWLFPSLLSRGWMHETGAADLEVGAGIVRLILEEFNTLLVGLASDKANNMVYVSTQGTLLGATEWANELHPNPDGFRKIAQNFVAPIARRFPGRAALRAVVASVPPMVANGPAGG
jgi:hypothetical protein